MAKSFFRTALQRVVEARERQASHYISGALINLDNQSLSDLGTSRQELRRKANTSYVF
jgi:hypothetical protein